MTAIVESLATHVQEAETILRSGGAADWADRLAKILGQLQKDGEDGRVTARELLSLYGGMGSLNDVVLFEGGKVLASQNERLDQLREIMFTVAGEIVASAP